MAARKKPTEQSSPAVTHACLEAAGFQNLEHHIPGPAIGFAMPITPPVPPHPSARFLSLVELAIERGSGVEQLEKLMDLQRKWEADEAKKAFFEAKAALQSKLPTIKKQKQASFETRNGGTMNYAYASLDDITEAIKNIVYEHGFSYRWEQSAHNGVLRVECVLTHFKGHSESCVMEGPNDNSGLKNPLQALASGMSYLRRYTLTGVLGLATADADIDGRLPEPPHNPTESDILNTVLKAAPATFDQLELIRLKIKAASSVAELKEAGDMIVTMPDGELKETLKIEYIDKLKQLKAAAATEEQP